MSRAATLAIGASVVVVLAAFIGFLIFLADELHPQILLLAVIFFQLSFLWTCAEFIDTPDEIVAGDDPEAKK